MDSVNSALGGDVNECMDSVNSSLGWDVNECIVYG
jgi:hypothetical protein